MWNAAIALLYKGLSPPSLAPGRLFFWALHLGWQWLEWAVALGAVIISAAVAGGLILGGGMFRPALAAPDIQRLSLAKGLTRPFSTRGLMVLASDVVKSLLLGSAGFFFLWSQKAELFRLLKRPAGTVIPDALRWIGQDLIWLCGLLLVPTLMDLIVQRRLYLKRLGMTRTEVKEEHRESEGSPEIKGRVRTLRRKLARMRMMKAVESADVVVVNPTHFAAALAYDERRMAAPTMVAKGADDVALKIREIARTHGVPVVEAPQLARSLHRFIEVGDPVPQGLYPVIAVLLAYVEHLELARMGTDEAPEKPDLRDIPDVYRVPEET